MEIFIKTYGIFIGFFLGIIGMYFKHLIDKKLDAKRTKNKLKKLFSLIEESKPPEWIQTYNEDDYEVIYNAFHKNGSNMSQFESRIQAVNAYTKEISKDVYSNLDTNDIIRFDSIKWWLSRILKNINEENEKINLLDFSASKELNKYDLENLNKKDKVVVQQLLEKANANQSEFNHIIRSTSLYFMMVGFGHEHMMEACNKKDFSILKYDYDYEKDDEKQS